VARSPLPAVRRCRQNFKPYIFSQSEIRRLLDGTETYQCFLKLLEPYTLRTLLLLLYGTGLRISEAVALKQVHVDIEQRVILIDKAKFYKTRLVGLGCDLCEALAKYRRQRSAAGHSTAGDAPFFSCKGGQPMEAYIVRCAFVRLRKHVGIERSDAKQQPRLHDLRHTFAVHRLLSWYRSGADLQRLLPLLSTYLGHICLESTKHYLTITPELLTQAGSRFERYIEAGGD
jgi:site-specific recombinase XerD